MKSKFEKTRDALLDLVDESGDITLVSVVYDSSQKLGDVNGVCFGSKPDMAFALAEAMHRCPELQSIVERALEAKRAVDIKQAMRAQQN